MKLSLTEAFGRFGAKPAHRQHALSAIAADGSLVLKCSPRCFGHPAQGVLRYEDRLSRETGDARSTELLGEHLQLARDENLPVRMVVVAPTESRSGRPEVNFHVRPDLVGRLVEFDGDRFVVDFTRLEGNGGSAGPGPSPGTQSPGTQRR